MMSPGGVQIAGQSVAPPPKALTEIFDLIALVRDPDAYEAKLTELKETLAKAKETVDAANELIKEIDGRDAALDERQEAAETAAAVTGNELAQRTASLDARDAALDERDRKLAEAKVALKAEREEVARIKAEAAEQLARLQAAVGE